jgi:hypothetical protein
MPIASCTQKHAKNQDDGEIEQIATPHAKSCYLIIFKVIPIIPRVINLNSFYAKI